MLPPSIIMILGSSLLSWAFYQGFLAPELSFAWVLNLINAFGSRLIHEKALGKDVALFFRWSLLVNAFRAGLVLLAIIGAKLLQFGDLNAILLFTIFGYFSYLSFEVFRLHKASIKP